MIRWWKGILKDIQDKTGQMDKDQKLEYIFTYYWYHILIAAIGLGIFVLLIYHIFFGEKPKEFTCVMVNQAIDYERDERLLEDFAADSGILAERISIDSNYVFSYVGKQLEGANESSYDKFFFGMGAGELNAAVIPESFYRYCMELEYEFVNIGDMLTKEQKELWQGELLGNDGVYSGIYVEKMYLREYIQQDDDDPAILVFLQSRRDSGKNRAFLAFSMGQ
jgi:hypothetical protein